MDLWVSSSFSCFWWSSKSAISIKDFHLQSHWSVGPLHHTLWTNVLCWLLRLWVRICWMHVVVLRMAFHKWFRCFSQNFTLLGSSRRLKSSSLKSAFASIAVHKMVPAWRTFSQAGCLVYWVVLTCGRFSNFHATSATVIILSSFSAKVSLWVINRAAPVVIGIFICSLGRNSCDPLNFFG